MRHIPKIKRFSKKSDSGHSGFTLVELLVALMVSSVVLTAVATLAYALGSANDSTDDTSRKQAQVRYTTLRISELVRHCKLVCYAGPADFAVWRADENNDGRINFSELVYIEKGAGANHLHFCEFPISWGWDPVVNLSDIGAFSTSWWAARNMAVESTALIPQCSNVQFSFDALPPRTQFVSISFDLVEDNKPRQYQINAVVRGWAGNLLNAAGTALVSDDD
jgi:prepilin-type N-terminal cleavage/methylation domain-containing protein